MSLIDRARRRLTGDGSDPNAAWDAVDLTGVGSLLGDVARALDPSAADPRPAQSRAAVLGSFAARSAGPRHAAPARSRRVLWAPAVAGLLLIAGTAAVAASGPGGPLYEIRLASEALLLPGGTDARAIAEVGRLEDRVEEASAAAAVRNETALRASLEAYARIAREAAGSPPVDPAVRLRMAEQVRAQVAAINALGIDDPAITKARSAGQALVAALGGGGTSPWQSSPEAGPGSTVGPSGSARPTSSPRPTGPFDSGAPGSSPQPRRSGVPGVTPRPSEPPGLPEPSGTPAATPRASSPPGGPGPSSTPAATPRASSPPGGPGPSSTPATTPRASSPPGGPGPSSPPGGPGPSSTPATTPRASSPPGGPGPGTGSGSPVDGL